MKTMTTTEARKQLFAIMKGKEPVRVVGRYGSVAVITPEKSVRKKS